MQVRETMKNELDAIIKDLIGKIDVPEGVYELSINEVFDLAEKNGSFNQKEYRYSEDEETLLDILVFSIGMSKLWKQYKEENPDATYIDVNYLIIDFMKHMWGLEKVPTIRAGNKNA